MFEPSLPLQHPCQTWLVDHNDLSCWVSTPLKTVPEVASTDHCAILEFMSLLHQPWKLPFFQLVCSMNTSTSFTAWKHLWWPPCSAGRIDFSLLASFCPYGLLSELPSHLMARMCFLKRLEVPWIQIPCLILLWSHTSSIVAGTQRVLNKCMC